MNDADMSPGVRPRVALVTGATGFIGSHLVSALSREGWQVHIVSRGSSHLPVAIESCIAGNQVHDGTTEGMHRLVESVKPDVVFHLASLFLSQHTSKDIEPLVTSNVLFGCQLLEAMARNRISCLVNTGTSWQHYENRDYSPVNLYAATKQAFEAIVQYYVEAERLRVISLKLFDTYGAGDARPKLMNLLRQMAKQNQELSMSPGGQRVDLVHVDDVVRAYLLAADRLLNGIVAGHECYAVSSGRPLQLRELVQVVESELGRSLPIKWGGRPYRDREVMIPWAGDALPGWTAQIGLEQGIKELFRESW